MTDIPPAPETDGLRVMLDTMRHGVMLVGPDRRVVTANALAAEYTGLRPEDLRPGTDARAVRKAQVACGELGDAATAQAWWDKGEAIDRSRPFSYTRRRPNGRVLAVASSPTPDGGFVVTYTDITDRAAAEAAAQEQAATLQALLDKLRLGVVLFGADRRVKAANALSSELAGLPPGGIHPGLTLAAVLAAQTAHNATGDAAEAATLEAEALALDRSWPFQRQRNTADGRRLEVRSEPMPDGGFVITHLDITALARAEAAAQQRADLLQATLDHMRHGVAMFGPDHRLVSINQLAAQLNGPTGTPPQPGMTLEQVLRSHQANGFFDPDPDPEAALHRLLEADRRQPLRGQRQLRDGRVMEIASDPMPDGGFIITYFDVTARARAEAEAARHAEAMQATLDNIQHGIALYGPDRRLRTANRLAGPSMGLPPLEQHLGERFDDLVEQQRRAGTFGAEPAASQRAASVRALDRRQRHRYLRHLPGGKVVEVTSAPTPDGGFVIAHADVTALEQARAEAQQRATALQAMLDNIRHGIALYGPDSRLIAANPLAADLAGLAPEDFRPGAAQEELMRLQHARGAFGSGTAAAAQLAEGLARDWRQPFRFQRRDARGRIIDVATNPTPDGGFVLSWSDVTALAEAEAEASSRASVLQLMMDSMHHGIALFDAGQRLVAANALAAALNGLDFDVSRVGASLTELMQDLVRHGQMTPEQMQAQLRLDRTRPQRHVRLTATGLMLEVRTDPTPDGGFVITYSDITEVHQARAEAQRRADLMQLVLDNMHHGIVRYDAERRLLMANRLALELHGLPPETDLVGMREPDIVRLLYERGEVSEMIWRNSETADIASLRHMVRTRPNGQVVMFAATPTPDGGYVVTISDITELTRAEQAAQQRAAILGVMLDNIRHGICFYGPDRRVVAANALAETLGGHAPGTLRPGRLLDELIAEQVANGAVPPEARAVAAQALALDRSRPARHVRRSGDGRVLEVTSDPTPDGGFVVTSTDITRLAEAEAVAQSRAAVMEVMLGNIRHGIVLFGPDHRLLTANPVAGQLLAVPAAALARGQHYHDYVRSLHAAGVYGNGAAAAEEAAAIIHRFEPGTPTRRLRQLPSGQAVEVVSDPTPDGGFVLTYTDVTEDRRIRTALQAAREAAEAANLAKSRFLATMTHELRTPLNAVIGFSEALQTAPDRDRAAEYTRSIHEAGRHLLSLVDDILDVTRAETTGFQIAEAEVELAPLCESAVRVMRAAAAKGQVTLGLQLAPTLPAVRADEVRLRQVLLNLLSNAVKFTPPEGRVTLSAALEADGALAVKVADTGIGVKPEDVPRAFEPFTQLEASHSRRFPGSGLGLYLSRALAEAQGATLTLEGGGGAGALAVLRFPPSRLVPPGPPQPPITP